MAQEKKLMTLRCKNEELTNLSMGNTADKRETRSITHHGLQIISFKNSPNSRIPQG